MASGEEARKAFREYMSNASTNNGQQTQAQAQQAANLMPQMNPYAASLQAGAYGYQPPPPAGFNPYAGQAGMGFNPAPGVVAPIPTTATPHGQVPTQSAPANALATAQQIAATQGGSSLPPPPQPPGYMNLPRGYGPPQQPQPTGAYNAGWPYANPAIPPQNTAPGAAPYKGAWPPPDVPQYPEPARNDMPVIVPAHIATASDPVYVLSHVCSVCGRVRSSGYHRHHPIVPGQPAAQTPCRRCKKKAKKKSKRDEKEDHTITIRIEDGSGRGRTRNRSEFQYVTSNSSPSPQRHVVRASSRANIGLRVLQEERSQGSRRKSRIVSRCISPSPPHETRGRYRAPGSFPSPDPPEYETRVRYVETSLSPPPLRRSTRVEYREESLERSPPGYRPRSLSPIRVPRRGYRSDDAEVRIASHPAAFRVVAPEHRSHLREPEGSHSTDSPTRGLSPRRGILRNRAVEFETGQPRRMYDNHDSMLPEAGNNKVRFVGRRSRPEGRHETDLEHGSHGRRERYSDERLQSNEDYHYRHRTEREYVEAPRSPSPIARSFERLRIRRSSPPSSRDYDFDAHVRYVSPDDHHLKVRARHVSPPRNRSTRGRVSPPGTPPPRSEYRASARARGAERASLALPDPRYEDWEDVTDSDTDASADVVQYVRYKEFDQHGRPYDIVEERRTRKVSGPPGGAARGPEEAPRAFPSTPALTRSYSVM